MKCVICNHVVHQRPENDFRFNKITYERKTYPICDDCAEKIKNNIKYDEIIKTERGQILDTLIKCFFNTDYAMLMDYENDYYFQPTVEDVFKGDWEPLDENDYLPYRKEEDFISSMNQLKEITNEDEANIRVIWNYYNEQYFEEYRGELANKSIYYKGDDRSGPLWDEELNKYIEKLKEYFNIKGE